MEVGLLSCQLLLTPVSITESGNETKCHARVELTDTMVKPYAILCEMNKLLASENEADYDKAFVSAAIKSFDDYRSCSYGPWPGYFRPITSQRREGINNFYEQAALSMYTGLATGWRIMPKGDSRQKHIAELFSEAQKHYLSATLLNVTGYDTQEHIYILLLPHCSF